MRFPFGSWAVVLALLGAGAGRAQTFSFDSTLEGWTFWTDAHADAGEVHTFQAGLDSAEGLALPPSARVEGDWAAGSVTPAHAHLFGVERTFTGVGPNLLLSFNYRAQSTSSGNGPTNLTVRVLEPGGQSLYSATLIKGGTDDTGWSSYSTVVPLGGASSFTVRFTLNDAWNTPYEHTIWLDDVHIQGVTYWPNGYPCSTGADCFSSVCSSGVCCDRACDGPCGICNADAGAAVTGTCTLFDAGIPCRPADGVCDVPETCTGAGPSCPADTVAGTQAVCRPSVGPCDLAERCDGATKACPIDQLASSAVTCRPSNGPCDVPEVCDGTQAGCPGDALRPAGEVCRPASGVCDEVVETCTGTAPGCPDPASLPDGTPCDGGTCQSGSCVAAPVDAGSPNPPPTDAGVGRTKRIATTGCACSTGGDGLALLSLVLVAARRRSGRRRASR